MTVTNEDKWIIGLMSGLIFLLISSPFLYKLTNSISTRLFGVETSSHGCPTVIGLLLHSIIFVLVVRVMMR